MSRLRHYVLHFLPLVILVAALLSLPLLTFAAPGDPNFAQELVWGLVVAVTGRLVWIGGIILDAGINTFVIDFGFIFLNSGVGVAVDNTWIVIRDFMNLLFIFGLVYIGFKMILGSDNSNTRRWLVNLILAALLINFSLFITKFVVDFSNQISTAIVESAFETKTETVSGVSKNRVQMSNSLMNLMGISSIIGGSPGGESVLKGRVTSENAWGYIFGTGIFFLITAFVFTAGGILLIIRFVALSLYIVMSPLMFVGWILPPVSSIMSQYWKGFLKRAFFAPIYFLFLYLSFVVLINFQQSIGGLQSGAWSNSLGGDGSAAVSSQSVIPFFVLVCGFMIASILVAQKLGADGADTAIKYGKMARQKVQRGLTNTGKFAAAQTAGRAARAASTGTGRATEGILRRAQSLQGDSVIARATRGIARSNAVQSTVGGAAASMQNTKFGLKRTITEDRKMRNQTDEKADREQRQRADRNVPPITATSTDAEITARQEARRRQQNDVRDMSNDEIISRARTNRDEIMSAEFASLLTDAHVKALRESGILTNADMDSLEESRDEGTFAEITATLENSNASTANLTATMEELNRVMATMSSDRLQGMMRFDATTGALQGPLASQAVASRLTSAQVDAMRQSGRASSVQMTQITDTRNDGFVTIARHGSLGDPAAPGGADAGFQDRQRRGMFKNPQDAGKLPVDVLAATASQQYLTPRIIEEFLGNNPSDAHIGLVRANVDNYLATNTAPAGVDKTWKDWSRRTVAGKRFALINI